MVMLSPAVTAHNLTAWFVLDPDAAGRDYAVLEGAIAAQLAVLHETSQVNQLLIENLGDLDLFIQAGDIVKGGKQDRTIGTDFIVPARSGRVPLPAYCVEHARWSPRRAEPVSHFSESKHALASKKARLAMLMDRDQGKVWESVGDEQQQLRDALDGEVRAAASPSSLELTYEQAHVRMAVDDYFPALDQAVAGAGDAVVGVVWAINGRLSHADRYGNAQLFAKLWRKLQRAAATEALGERRRMHPQGASDDTTTPLPTDAEIRRWLGAEGPAPSEGPEAWRTHEEAQLPPRTRLRTERARQGYRFSAYDTAVGAAGEGEVAVDAAGVEHEEVHGVVHVAVVAG